MFRVSQHPSSGVLKTVTTASGTGHTTCNATPLQRGLIGTQSSCGCRSRGWHSTVTFVSPNISSPQSIESSMPVSRQRTVPSHHSGRRFSLPHPVPVLRSVPTLHQSNVCCPLALLPHFLLGAHQRSPSVYSVGPPPPPSPLHQTSDF